MTSLSELKAVYSETNTPALKQKAAIELALFEFENGNRAAAVDYLSNIAIRLDDSNRETYIKLGEVYMEIGDFSRSEQIFSELL